MPGIRESASLLLNGAYWAYTVPFGNNAVHWSEAFKNKVHYYKGFINIYLLVYLLIYLFTEGGREKERKRKFNVREKH